MIDLEKQIKKYKRNQKYSFLAIIFFGMVFPLFLYYYLLINYHNLSEYFRFILFISIVLCYFPVLKQFINTDIQDFVKLTDNQIWYYNWMEYLDKRKVITNMQEFEEWMSGFEDRYSEDQMFAMKLFFKVKEQ